MEMIHYEKAQDSTFAANIILPYILSENTLTCNLRACNFPGGMPQTP